MNLSKEITGLKRGRMLESILKKGQRYRITDLDGFSLEGEYRYIYDADGEIDMTIRNVVDPLHKSELDGKKELILDVNDMLSIEPV